MTDPATDTPPSLLMEYILAVLAPLLIAGNISDLSVARLSAMEAIAAYKARGEEELMTIAQIAGFAIAALDNLRLSAAPELSVSLKLKLRGNAAALNRAGRGNTADLRMLRREESVPEPEDDERAREEALETLEAARASVRQAEATLPQAALPGAALPGAALPADPPPAETADRRRAVAWAGAMTDVAAEFSRELAGLSPVQRRAEIVRIGLLSQTARQISQNGRKSGLLNSTSLTADQSGRFRDTSATASRTAATTATIAVASA